MDHLVARRRRMVHHPMRHRRMPHGRVVNSRAMHRRMVRDDLMRRLRLRHRGHGGSGQGKCYSKEQTLHKTPLGMTGTHSMPDLHEPQESANERPDPSSFSHPLVTLGIRAGP